MAGGVAELAGAGRGSGAEVAGGGDRGAAGGVAGGGVAALRWAAVLGEEFSVADLEVVTGRSAGELMGVVVQAVAAGVLAGGGVTAGVPAWADPPGAV